MKVESIKGFVYINGKEAVEGQDVNPRDMIDARHGTARIGNNTFQGICTRLFDLGVTELARPTAEEVDTTKEVKSSTTVKK